MVESIKSAV